MMAEDRMRDIMENLAQYRNVTLGELMEKMGGKHETGRKG
jgi:DeoR/GlpR family transcriptional regulator of sugar metabolism